MESWSERGACCRALTCPAALTGSGKFALSVEDVELIMSFVERNGQPLIEYRERRRMLVLLSAGYLKTLATVRKCAFHFFAGFGEPYTGGRVSNISDAPYPATSSSFVASASAGLPVWPAAMLVDQAPVRFASEELLGR